MDSSAIPIDAGSVKEEELVDRKEEKLAIVRRHDTDTSTTRYKTARDDDDDDDDCLILDGDPDNAFEVKYFGSDDDLIVVGEKGQIACRDYPHSRHLCVIFPFSSTPHNQHCSSCYCYVCDAPAPCIRWGDDALLTGHCHATDKSVAWRIRRKSFKEKVARGSRVSICWGNGVLLAGDCHATEESEACIIWRKSFKQKVPRGPRLSSAITKSGLPRYVVPHGKNHFLPQPLLRKP